MAVTINDIARYTSWDNGNTWSIAKPGVTTYIYASGNATRSCYSFTYTPTNGSKAREIEFICDVMISYGSGNIDTFFELYNSEFPAGTPIETVKVTRGRWSGDNANATTCKFTIPEELVIDEETKFSVRIYGWATSSSNHNEYLCWSGTATVTEVAASHDVVYTYEGAEMVDKKIPGEALTLRGVTFYRKGYSQIGWSVSEGGDIDYGIGASYTEDKAITLYPVWGIAPKAVLWLLLSRIRREINGN